MGEGDSGITLGPFFDRNADACWVIHVGSDEQLELIAMNMAHSKATGLTPAEVLGRSPTAFMPEGIRRFAADRLIQIARTGTAQEFVDAIAFPAGTRIWKTRLVPVTDPAGKVCWILGFGTDVTEASRAADALQQSERRHRALLDTLHDGVWQIDREGRTTYANPRMAELLGCAPEEMLGKPAASFCDDAQQEVLQSHLRNRKEGVKESYEFSFHTRDGRTVHTLVSAAPQFDDEGELCGSVAGVQDITDRIEAEAERSALERKLLETQKLESLGVLAGGIAHDFNNILTGILGSASLALLDIPQGSRAREHMVQIEEASRRAADLCRQMLAYAGRGHFAVQNVDLGELLRETTELLKLSISKKASLRYDLASALPLVSADATQLRQVLMNLVLNASEALGDRPGSITLTTGVRRIDAHFLRTASIEGDLASGPYVFLEVHDSGCGMSEETIARIFDPFFTTKFTGRGLGLSAVLGIVRGHSGAIKVTSDVGRGTTFTVFLPALASDAESVRPPPPADEWRGHGTVLVIDDEPIVCRVIERILAVLGFDPVVSPNGRAGLGVVRERGSELTAVLLDLTMPEMDGETTFREIRALRPALPIVLMSGYNEQEAIARFVGQGLAAFLQKPFTLDAMRDGLRGVLEP